MRVRRLLETEPDIDLVAVREDSDSLRDRQRRPDVVLTDIRMHRPGPTRASVTNLTRRK